MNQTAFLNDITKKLRSFDYISVQRLCEELIHFLFSSNKDFDTKVAEKIMQRLRNKRQFLLMQKVGDTLIQTQNSSFKIKRQYAQALIDQNNFTASLLILEEILQEATRILADKDTPHNQFSEVKEEYAEIKGLLGRTYKQLYINANNPKNKLNANYLKKAIELYFEVYQESPKQRTWHGINVVALLHRAQEDDIIISGYLPIQEIAQDILRFIEEKHDDKNATTWDFATAAEACLALGHAEDALLWLSAYARDNYCDAFELASTLRQLEEVWRLKSDSKIGAPLLSQLRAELMKREGGALTISSSELHQNSKTDEFISNAHAKYSSEKNNPASSKLEKVFNDTSFNTHRWFSLGLKRCAAVARIGTNADKGVGTGFLLKGDVLHKSLGEELILVTNAHIISDPPERNALRPQEAVVIFEVIERNIEFKGVELIWSSPSSLLDATLVRFQKEDQNRLKELTKDIDFYPISNYMPILDSDFPQRIYIIGHPYGGTLQLSFQDNTLLDHQKPKIHYRTPTEGGSSGSPVFNQEWDLIGLHHSGDRKMKRLNDKEGFYEANEGIWIKAIIEELEGYFS